MSHDNRNQIRIPARLWDDMCLALDQALARIQMLDTDPAIVTRQVYEFGERTLKEARRRANDKT